MDIQVGDEGLGKCVVRVDCVFLLSQERFQQTTDTEDDAHLSALYYIPQQ